MATGVCRDDRIVALLLGIIAALVVIAAPASSQANDRRLNTSAVFPAGDWTPPDMDAVISIRPCGDALCARLVQHDYAEVTNLDINNPNPAMRTRPLLGVRILDGLRRVTDNRWSGGKLYDPRTGKTYFSKLKLVDRNRLKIIGCIGPQLCKGYIWKRVGS